MSNLFFTIGLPRSGKSTYCKKWAAEKSMRSVVSSDSIRLAATGQRYNPYSETLVFATKHIMIRALLDYGFDVIVDGTHSTEVSLTRLYEIDINARHVIIPTTAKVCRERAIATNQADLIPSINRIDNNLLHLDGLDSFLEYVREKVRDRNLYGNL